VTQVTHYLLEHLSVRGAVETFVLLAIVWLGWIHTVWLTNYFHLGNLRIRLMLIGIMFAGLLMSAALPQAFEARGLEFAAAAVVVLTAGTVFLLIAISRDHHLAAVLERVLVWFAAVGALLIAGASAEGDGRLALWAVAVGVGYGSMWLGFPTPRLGRSLTGDYTVVGMHFVHRCLLFITLALGEAILITGTTFGELSGAFETTVAFALAFLSTVALWWLYFDRTSERMHVVEEASDPGRLALIGFTLLHIPMVVGIICSAAADELVLAHPGEEVSAATALLVLGGPALFLAATFGYRLVVMGNPMPSRLVGLAALVVISPLAAVASGLALSAAATTILVGVAAWDTRATRRGQPRDSAPATGEGAPSAMTQGPTPGPNT
jgi:low temperature requirement protein LtrA